MTPLHKRRMLWIILFVAGIGLAISLMLYALKQNINLFYTPTQIATGMAPSNHSFRVGGIVMKGSVQRSTSSLQVSFRLSDHRHQVRVTYHGLLPDLFREGQGIVAEGKLNHKGVFMATQVLAKHDADYMPAMIKQSLTGKKNPHARTTGKR